MSCGLKIPSFKDLSLNKYEMFDKIEYVYIPLVSQWDENITVTVKKNDSVLVGSVVGRRRGNLKIPILSSISGTVIDFVDKYYLNGKLVRCVVIKNDFKYRRENKIKTTEDLSSISKNTFLKNLKDNGIVGMGGSGFPTYIKYDTDIKIKTLLVNAVECEPYITSDLVLARDKAEEILETIDAIMEINNIDKAYICIKKDNPLKSIFETYLGTYLNIKVVEVKKIYPMGWERKLIKEVLKETYNKIPIEKGIVVNNVSTIYAIYKALKFDESLTERVVTITGDGIKEPKNLLLKNGTLIKDVIEQVGGYTTDNVKLIGGGPMMGYAIGSDELTVTPNLNCVLILKFGEKEQLLECLRCGKCVDACPANLSPVLIKDNLKNADNLKELKPERCIECGLCSYVCPSKIKVREFVKKAKEIMESRKNDEV